MRMMINIRLRVLMCSVRMRSSASASLPPLYPTVYEFSNCQGKVTRISIRKGNKTTNFALLPGSGPAVGSSIVWGWGRVIPLDT